MTPRRGRQISYVLLACFLAISSGLLGRETPSIDPGLTAHEWGTFTSIAGERGLAADWSPLAGPPDLPAFVEHFRNPGFKLGLRGTIRMETPVLYFYGSREVTLSVRVGFDKGVITEWYPRPTRVEPVANLVDGALCNKQTEGSIAWDSVTLAPHLRVDFPVENLENHYYAARQTSSTPLRVKTTSGDQQEKFLFYRGVSASSLPISARLTPDGRVLVENHSEEEIPEVILFERRGEKVGFRIGSAVKNRAILDPPALTETQDSLTRELEGVLVSHGLYQDEAQAMLETWRHSWFEEGSRLFYIVPSGFLNTVVPLSIRPAPSHTVRVFVGRLELVTPATERAVDRALATEDQVTLGKYRRFLEPILQAMIRKERNPAKLRMLQQSLDSVYSEEVARNQGAN